MSDFDKLLEGVARDWDLHACGDDACELEGADCLAEYLKRRLLPLLELAQKAYNGHSDYCHVGDPDQKNYPDHCVCLKPEWDKQKQAAMEGR